MVLSNFKYRCVLLIKIIAGQGPTVLAEGGWAFGFFSLVSFFPVSGDCLIQTGILFETAVKHQQQPT